MDEQVGRALAGDIARAALDRRGLKVRRAAEQLRMAPGTLYAIFDGAATVQTSTLRAFEGLVGLPWDLLTYVARGDVAAVEAMRFDDDGLQRYVLHRLRETQDADRVNKAKVRRSTSRK